MEEKVTSVEMQAVAEPATEESVETQGVAEPETNPGTGRTDADAAFAEMRRALKDAETERDEARRALADNEAKAAARKSVYQRLGVGENAEIDALAESLGVDADDVMASITAEEQAAQKDAQIRGLMEKVTQLSAEKQVNESIETLKKLDPTINDINDLGPEFVDFVGKGLTVEQAYFAVKGKEISTTSKPAQAVGKVSNEPKKKDFLTEAEFDAMTPEQQKANFELARKSMGSW